ncbi:Ribulose bisphosphate carboxylase small chain, chromosomal [Nocardia africana]|uniref:Ribulose bisphosphate carboxylase small chain, chromosomal n=1 Tax=Nocardia africana TaxID=134964 RepID=A0A378WVD4_9NOCA|nr:ribulose bisphosphate carboxylase small subunit [Nocardia africana]SUA45320.1 Ribulose bisphosphate carboxylase small chain, chromosomal [Nocardia africana]
MHLRQGTFSHLPDLTDAEIGAQIRYALLNNWPVSIEYTDDPHPRNVYWEMWGCRCSTSMNPTVCSPR